MFHSRGQSNTPCYNGPNCYYLAQGRCYFKHPEQHRQNHLNNQRNQRSNYFRNYIPSNIDVQQQTRRRTTNRNMQRFGLRMDHPGILRHSMINSLFINRIPIMSLQLSPPIGQLVIQQSEFQLDRNTKIDESNLKNYWQKNEHKKLSQINKQTLQKFDQCSICFQEFKQKKQQQHSKQKFQKQIKQIQEVQNQLKKSDRMTQQIKQQPILTQLRCKHLFHQQCIKNWLIRNPKCPLCKKDYRYEKEQKKENNLLTMRVNNNSTIFRQLPDYRLFNQIDSQDDQWINVNSQDQNQEYLQNNSDYQYNDEQDQYYPDQFENFYESDNDYEQY